MAHTEGKAHVESYDYKEGGIGCHLWISDSDVAAMHYTIRDGNAKDNALRLAACWNACEGMSLTDVNHLNVKRLVDAAKAILVEYIHNSDRGLPYISGTKKSHAEDGVAVELRAALAGIGEKNARLSLQTKPD